VELGGEGLETGPLVSCGLLRRMAPPRIGQAGPRQVDGPAQLRVRPRLQAIGPGQAPVDLILRWSQCGHHPQGAVYAQLVGAVITAPGLRRNANAGGEAGAVPFGLHRVAAEGGAEDPVSLCDDGMALKRRRLVVFGPIVFGVEGMQVSALHLLPGIPGDRHIGAAGGADPARGFRVTQVVQVRCAVVGAEHHVPAVQAAVPPGDHGHRRTASRQFGSGGRGPSVAMAAGHDEHMGPCRPPGPVRQHERVAIQDQIHQRGTFRRGHRPQIAGQSGHIGEHVHRPEPAREVSRRNHAPDVPGPLVDQDPTSGPGGATRPPVALDREDAITVRPHLAHLEVRERRTPPLWVIGHASMFGPPRTGQAGKARKQPCCGGYDIGQPRAR
jgi:hypothetical protein